MVAPVGVTSVPGEHAYANGFTVRSSRNRPKLDHASGFHIETIGDTLGFFAPHYADFVDCRLSSVQEAIVTPGCTWAARAALVELARDLERRAHHGAALVSRGVA